MNYKTCYILNFLLIILINIFRRLFFPFLQLYECDVNFPDNLCISFMKFDEPISGYCKHHYHINSFKQLDMIHIISTLQIQIFRNLPPQSRFGFFDPGYFWASKTPSWPFEFYSSFSSTSKLTPAQMERAPINQYFSIFSCSIKYPIPIYQ